ncbi:hypothetical protein RirG_031990 [Rhizophagus irregularis DAOM 197198w]|uniref:Uncharacterized protein n=1 Tax=Rhizophagus irregularis (strain DAOM 197198w) TaxID=1432141 RepID=A0A015LA36_RHIIW|nr:hypothetical protein RirG_031990 [Rhizophagus irregularis DAOM 197198w]
MREQATVCLLIARRSGYAGRARRQAPPDWERESTGVTRARVWRGTWENPGTPDRMSQKAWFWRRKRKLMAWSER